MKDLREVVNGCILNKYDCVIFVEGKRGIGKSTLIYKLALLLNRGGVVKFNPNKCLVYSREDTLRLLANETRTVIFSDEMINVTYKRDFYEEQQKQLIKALNMYRDSCNVFVGAVPIFKNLDSDMRELCKIKISVIRRGLAYLYIQPDITEILESQQHNTNNKNKRFKGKELVMQPTKKVGILLFRNITPAQRATYERIKKYKRGQVFSEDANVVDPWGDWYNRLYEQVISRKLDKESFEAIVDMAGKKMTTVKSRLGQILRDNKKSTLFTYFKTPDKVKDEELKQIYRRFSH